MNNTANRLAFFMICGLSAISDGDTLPGGFLPLPESLLPMNSEKGREIFRSSSSAAFWPLVQFYNTQPDLGSCGVASSVMVLNALEIPRPEGSKYGDFRLFTPENFFTPAVTSIKSRAEVSESGMSLDQLSRILGTYPVKVVKVYAEATRIKDFRDQLKQSLSGTKNFVLVNYLRKAIGQKTGGHISPLGAYAEKEDLVLILDVSNYKYPWVWVKIPDLFQAMASRDEGVEQSRGYVVVSAKEAAE